MLAGSVCGDEGGSPPTLNYLKIPEKNLALSQGAGWKLFSRAPIARAMYCGREAEVLNDGFGSNCDLQRPSALGLECADEPTFGSERRLRGD